MPAPDPRTGIPMEVVLLIETEADQSLLCSGSYYSRERIYDTMIVTDRDSYRLNILESTLTTGAGTRRSRVSRRTARAAPSTSSPL